MRSRDRPNLIKSYGMTTLTSEGFFHDLWEYSSTRAIVIPFLLYDWQAQALDTYYFFNNSGDKKVSQLVNRFVDDDKVLPEAARMQIAETFWRVHGNQLLRQWQNDTVVYSPERPYDIHEETDYIHENTGSVTDSGSVTDTKSGAVTNVSGEQTGGDWVYGFDSTGEPTISGGEGDSRYKEDAIYNRTLYGKDDSGSGDPTTSPLRNVRDLDTTKETTDSSTDELSTHKYGSLGTTAMGEIMSKEFEAWMWNFFLLVLFPAVDKTLALPIY